MTRIIDISLPLNDSIPIWPGSEGVHCEDAMRLDCGDPANVTVLHCDVHTGTHIDVPRHFFPGGKTVDSFQPEVFIGSAYVVHLSGRDRIAATDLENSSIPEEVSRLLLRTDNSRRWRNQSFDENYTWLTRDAASWIAARGIRLLGFDYLSIERYGAEPVAHRTLMEHEVVILEGLDLNEVEAGWYELLCFPLRLVGREGAPVRALLRAQKREEP